LPDQCIEFEQCLSPSFQPILLQPGVIRNPEKNQTSWKPVRVPLGPGWRTTSAKNDVQGKFLKSRPHRFAGDKYGGNCRIGGIASGWVERGGTPQPNAPENVDEFRCAPSILQFLQIGIQLLKRLICTPKMSF